MQAAFDAWWPAAADVLAPDAGQDLRVLADRCGIKEKDGVILEILMARSKCSWSAGTVAALGTPITTVATQFGITSAAGRVQLEFRAIGRGAKYDNPLPPAGQAVHDGENVNDVALRFGITTWPGTIQLEQAAADSNDPRAARHAIRNGEPYQTAARRFGITDEMNLYNLKRVEAFARAGVDMDQG